MWKTTWLLLLLMTLISAKVDVAHLYCPLDSPSRIYGNVEEWLLDFDEYPSPINSGFLSQKIDACTALAARDDKLQAGILKEGSFVTTYCTPRCAFTLAMGYLECAERRLPIQWSATFPLPSQQTSKVDCSNISLPLAIDNYPENRVILSFSGNGLVPDAFLSSINALPVEIEWLLLPLGGKYNGSIYKPVLQYLSQNMPTITKIAITNDQHDNVDPTNLLSLLKSFPNVKEFSMNGVVNLKNLPDFMKGNRSRLIALRLEGNALKTFPSWATNLVNLQYLKVQDYGMNPSFISKLNLPALEHFIMIGNNFSVLPADFLLTSQNLIHLDLSCNLIEMLPESLEHLSKLKFLYLAGNLFRTLPPTLLPSFPKLISLDVARFLNGISYEIGSGVVTCRTIPADDIIANHTGIESFNKSHLTNSKYLKVLNLNGNTDLVKLDDGIFDMTPRMRYISMRRIGFPSLNGIGLCGLCRLEFLEVSYNTFQTPSWIEEECGLGWPMMTYIGLAYVNLTLSTPTLSLMALSSESMYAKIEYFFYTNPIFNDPCELADFYSMIEGVPSWRSTPACQPKAKEKIDEINALRPIKYAVRQCSVTDVSSYFFSLIGPLLVLLSIL